MFKYPNYEGVVVDFTAILEDEIKARALFKGLRGDGSASSAKGATQRQDMELRKARLGALSRDSRGRDLRKHK